MTDTPIAATEGGLLDLVSRALAEKRGVQLDLSREYHPRSKIGEIMSDARAVVEALATRTCSLGEDVVREACKPWADYHGDLPDYDHPLRPVYESGIQYAVELLAKELGVTDWTPCDGTEEFDGDLGGTLMNIVLAAMPKDAHGDPIYPRDVRAALSALRPVQEEGVGEELRASLEEVAQMVEAMNLSGFRLGAAQAIIAGRIRALASHSDASPPLVGEGDGE